jgi:hypothetical protein
MFVFKSWKESILNAEIIHQEEENKFKLSAEHPQSYYITDTILQSGTFFTELHHLNEDLKDLSPLKYLIKFFLFLLKKTNGGSYLSIYFIEIHVISFKRAY